MDSSHIVVGLMFGDEGKGTTVDFLCNQYEESNGKKPNAVVRFSGGPQTAHNVVMPDGRHHTFAQFGSGTLRGVRTIISKYMLINPLNMANEAAHLIELTGDDPFKNTLISENSLLITPLHRLANKTRETRRGANAHGSCGQGIGEAMEYGIHYPLLAPKMGDLLQSDEKLKRLITLYRDYLVERGDVSYEDCDSVDDILEALYAVKDKHQLNIVSDEIISSEIRKGYNVFEGSQGILLDEWFGFHPHTTWSTTTSKNAQTLLYEAGLSRGHVIGVTRTYATRHGYGPFPSEFDPDSDWENRFPEKHNKRGVFQGAWRGGTLDAHLLKYAVAVNGGIDSISLTHRDVHVDEVVTGYPNLGVIIPSPKENLVYQEALGRFVQAASGTGHTLSLKNEFDMDDFLHSHLGAPVWLSSYGPTSEDKFIS